MASDKKAARARLMVAKALRRGELAKQPCRDCGSVDTLAHHPDYDKPMEVVWLCLTHYREEHIRIGDPRMDRGACLRIGKVPEETMRRLRKEAMQAGLTMREWCLRKLEVWDVGTAVESATGVPARVAARDGRDEVVAGMKARSYVCRVCGSLDERRHGKNCSLGMRL